MGAVYRAWDERLKRPVAVKHILPEIDDILLRERFRREAQAVASLNHPSIVHVYDIVEGDEEGDWIVMELVEGQRLDRLLRAGPPELHRALLLARELARGLAEAHAKGIVHRDLKAENVMVTADGHAKILDFGLAKLAREARDSDMSTTPGSVLGTARVMSPEQVMGLGVDHRSDLFSLGILFYEIFTGLSPFKTDAVVETLKRVCTVRQKPVSSIRQEVPQELSELIDRLLEKHPEKRPRGAREVIATLMRTYDIETPEEGTEDPPFALPETEEGFQDWPLSSAEESGDDPACQDSTTVPHRPLASTILPHPLSDTELDDAEPTTHPAGAEEEYEPAATEDSGLTTPEGGPPARLSTEGLPSTWGLEETMAGFERVHRLGERRQVTVLCLDLLGERPRSTFSVLDPEVLYEIMPQFRALARATIERFDGHLGHNLGHRLWAYFGYPRAHEDDAARAVRAALELVVRVRGIRAARPKDSFGKKLRVESRLLLALRAGIHTGLGVVPPLPVEGEIALGSTLEMAVKTHELAEPHTVLVSDATHRLIADRFETQPRSPVHLRGARFMGTDDLHRVYRVIDVAPKRLRSAEASTFVGRTTELQMLVELWQRVRKGRGQVVFLRGDAGIGKSRLLRTLRERLAADASTWWTTAASPYTRNSPLQPFVELLPGLLGVKGKASLLERLEQTLDEHGFSLREFVPLFASLLEVPLEGRYPPMTSAPAWQRARILEALGALFLEKAERSPAVMVVEDLQWADPSTLELLDHLLDQVPGVPLMLILSHRPDFDLPWSRRGAQTSLELSPLNEKEAKTLADQVADKVPLPAEIRRQIVSRTDGVPLFVEELTKTLLEIGSDIDRKNPHTLTPSTPLFIPTTLRDSLTARLDLLASAKTSAQRAAVIGREFSRELLAAISPFGAEELQREIDRLVESGLVLRDTSSANGARFLFKHALIQEIAYESLLKKERRQVHLEIAEALEGGRGTAAPPEVLARHYTRAHRPREAAVHWLESGRRSLKSSANVEAIEHLRKGLTVLGGLPPGHERDELELELECTLIPALIAVEGYMAPEVEQVMTRAYHLCRHVGDTPRLFWAVWALWTHHFLRGEINRAQELGSRLLRLADDDTHQLPAHHALGYTLYSRGDYKGAREHLERGLYYDSPDPDPAEILRAGQAVGVTTKSVLAMTLWHLGRSDRALELSNEALRQARELNHPYTQAFALLAKAWVLLFRRDAEALFRVARELVDYCREQDLWLGAVGTMLLRCASVELGLHTPSTDDGTDLVLGLERAIQSLVLSGVALAQTVGLCHLAESHLRRGRLGEARRFLDKAFELFEKGDEHHWAPELYRIRGELTLADGEAGEPEDRAREAEESFQRALSYAGESGDLALALRSAIRLSRLWRDQGLEAEARGLLNRACDGFGEGFETADWQEAQSLAQALG